MPTTYADLERMYDGPIPREELARCVAMERAMTKRTKAEPEFTVTTGGLHDPRPIIRRHGEHFMVVDLMTGAKALVAALNALAAVDPATICQTNGEFARDQIAYAAASVVGRRIRRAGE